MNILLVEPAYYSKFPPLGLLKLGSYYRSRGDKVKLVHGQEENAKFTPDRIEITSLFTYAWKPVHEAIDYYHSKYPEAKIHLGGIYASLMPERLNNSYPFADIHIGLFEKADKYLPAYDLLEEVDCWNKWDSTIVFTSRGCIRNCPYCVVPKLEGHARRVVDNIERYVYPGHKRIILWDNNFFALPDWKKALRQLQDTGLSVDFNQGIDCRLIDEEKATMIADIRTPIIRMAFDKPEEKEAIKKAVKVFNKHGIYGRKIFVYVLYNFYEELAGGDHPIEFFDRIQTIADLGCVSYPMRYEPLSSIVKNQFISPYWTKDQLDLVVRSRRILGYGGAFPPYEGLVNKFKAAKTFEEAFGVYPLKKKASSCKAA